MSGVCVGGGVSVTELLSAAACCHAGRSIIYVSSYHLTSSSVNRRSGVMSFI